MLIRISLVNDANTVLQEEELEFDSAGEATEFYEELLAELEEGEEDDGSLDLSDEETGDDD